MEIPCLKCGNAIESWRKKAEYCQPCRVIVSREQDKKRKANHRKKAKLGELPFNEKNYHLCKYCGEVYTIYYRKTCDDCLPKARELAWSLAGRPKKTIDGNIR